MFKTVDVVLKSGDVMLQVCETASQNVIESSAVVCSSASIQLPSNTGSSTSAADRSSSSTTDSVGVELDQILVNQNLEKVVDNNDNKVVIDSSSSSGAVATSKDSDSQLISDRGGAN